MTGFNSEFLLAQVTQVVVLLCPLKRNGAPPARLGMARV